MWLWSLESNFPGPEDNIGLKEDEDFANKMKSLASPSLLSQKLNRVTGI